MVCNKVHLFKLMKLELFRLPVRFCFQMTKSISIGNGAIEFMGEVGAIRKSGASLLDLKLEEGLHQVVQHTDLA